MTDPAVIDAAAQRLNQALELLESAVDRRLDIDRQRAGLAEQMHALDADRSRLVAELDAQLARTRQLEAANRDVARRIDAAMEGIRSVLDAKG
jgi:chromosome segregation ATPase